MNQQATEFENMGTIDQTRNSGSSLSDGPVSKEVIKNGLELISLVKVLLGTIQAKYADTMKSQDRLDFLTLTNELILVTEDLR